MIGQKRSRVRTQDPGVCRTGNAARRSRSARKVRHNMRDHIWVRRNASYNRAPRSRIGLAELFGRKVICHRQHTALVGFQGNLLGQHDVARDEVIVRYEAPARLRPASVVQLVDVRSDGVAYQVSLSGVAACDLEIVVRIVQRQLLGRQPFPQEFAAAELDCTWALRQ